MGLQEKRTAKAFKEGRAIELQKEINQIVGYDLPIELDWPSFEAEYNLDARAIENCFYRPVIIALKNIATDELGRSGLKAKIKKIQFYCHPDDAAFNPKLEGDVLKVATKQTQQDAERAAMPLQEMLERML